MRPKLVGAPRAGSVILAGRLSRKVHIGEILGQADRRHWVICSEPLVFGVTEAEMQMVALPLPGGVTLCMLLQQSLTFLVYELNETLMPIS